MEDPAVMIAITAVVMSALDKIIEIMWPNSRINNVFDVVVVFVNGAVAQLVGKKKR